MTVNNKLDEQAIREILVRAEQIHLGTTEQSEEDALLKAAEEAGLPRNAVEQALRERIAMQANNQGDFIFAPGGDGKLYIAEVLSDQNGITRAKFLNGSEVTFPSDQAMTATFLPGSKVQANWPAFGWWTCTVLGYDKPNRLVRLSDGFGTEKTISLTELRQINPDSINPLIRRAKALFKQNPMVFIIGAGLLFVSFVILLRNL